MSRADSSNVVPCFVDSPRLLTQWRTRRFTAGATRPGKSTTILSAQLFCQIRGGMAQSRGLDDDFASFASTRNVSVETWEVDSVLSDLFYFSSDTSPSPFRRCRHISFPYPAPYSPTPPLFPFLILYIYIFQWNSSHHHHHSSTLQSKLRSYNILATPSL